MSIADSFDLTIVWSILGLLIHLVVFGVCVYFVVQRQSSESFLLAIGSFIHLLTSLFYSVALPLFSKMGAEIYSNRAIFSVVGFFGFVGTICFSAGLVILIINHLKLANEKSVDSY